MFMLLQGTVLMVLEQAFHLPMEMHQCRLLQILVLFEND